MLLSAAAGGKKRDNEGQEETENEKETRRQHLNVREVNTLARKVPSRSPPPRSNHLLTVSTAFPFFKSVMV